MKVTDDPAQIVAGAEVNVTLTGKFGFTTITMEFDVAGLFEMQTVFEEVIVQVTTSAFAGVYVKVESLSPEPTPFTFHWNAGVVPP